jgi:hypothetical protein
VLTHTILGGLQVTDQAAGRQPTAESASASTPSPNPSQDRQRGTSGSNPSSRPRPAAAGSTKPVRRRPASDDTSIAASCQTQPDVEQSTAPAKPKSAPHGISRVDASPGRRVARTARVCSECGITADMVLSGKLQECGGCGTARYCGTACQRAHWPAHKPTCKELQAARQ